MESNTEKVFTSRQTARSAEVFGKMERESNGLMSNESGDRDIACLNFIMLTHYYKSTYFYCSSISLFTAPIPSSLPFRPAS
jgi:hypothetical protein